MRSRENGDIILYYETLRKVGIKNRYLEGKVVMFVCMRYPVWPITGLS